MIDVPKMNKQIRQLKKKLRVAKLKKEKATIYSGMQKVISKIGDVDTTGANKAVRAAIGKPIKQRW